MSNIEVSHDTTYSTSGVRAQVVETPAFQFTILECHRRVSLTKTVCADGKEIPYGKAKEFRFQYYEIETLEGFAEALDRLAEQPTKCIIRGRLKPNIDASKWQRRLLRPDGNDPATIECPPRRWIPFDFDGVEVPHGMGDPGALVEAGYYIRDNLLPLIFHQVKCVATASASTGRKGPTIARLRLFFVLSHPVATEPLHQWAKSTAKKYPQLKLDPSVMEPQQPIYTARPIFRGMGDPVPKDCRVVVLDGPADQIPTSWTGIEEYKPKKQPKPVVYNGDRDKAEAWRVVRWAFDLLAGCPKAGGEGRHETMKKVAWRLACEVKEGKISEALAREAYFAAAEGINNSDRRYGYEEIKDHLDWAFDGRPS